MPPPDTLAAFSRDCRLPSVLKTNQGVGCSLLGFTAKGEVGTSSVEITGSMSHLLVQASGLGRSLGVSEGRGGPEARCWHTLNTVGDVTELGRADLDQ